MLVIIFEGVDNLGKSTIISKFIEKYKDYYDITLMHATGPKKDIDNPFAWQRESFSNKAKKIVSIYKTEQEKTSSQNLILLDRAWAGEYVYGQIYRNGDPERIIADIVSNCETILSDNYITTVTIHLEASPEFVIAHDDNKSFTSDYDSSARYNAVKKEIALFNECYNKCKPTHYIKINVEGENLCYRNADIIFDEIINKMKLEHIL